MAALKLINHKFQASSWPRTNKDYLRRSDTGAEPSLSTPEYERVLRAKVRVYMSIYVCWLQFDRTKREGFGSWPSCSPKL